MVGNSKIAFYVQWCSNEMQLIKFEISQQLRLQFEWIKMYSQVLSGVVFMRWFTGYKVCMVLSWGVYLWICQFWTFSIIFFMEFEVGHMKEPFFLSRIPFFWWKNVAIFMSYRLWKVAILYGIFIENGCFQPHVAHK